MELCDEKRPSWDSAFNFILNFVFQGKPECLGGLSALILTFGLKWMLIGAWSTEEILIPWKAKLGLSSRLACPVVGHVAWGNHNICSVYFLVECVCWGESTWVEWVVWGWIYVFCWWKPLCLQGVSKKGYDVKFLAPLVDFLEFCIFYMLVFFKNTAFVAKQNQRTSTRNSK